MTTINDFLSVEEKVIALFRSETEPRPEHPLNLKKHRKRLLYALSFLDLEQKQRIFQNTPAIFFAVAIADESILLWDFLAKSTLDRRLICQKEQLLGIYAALRNGLSQDQQKQVQYLIASQENHPDILTWLKSDGSFSSGGAKNRLLA